MMQIYTNKYDFPDYPGIPKKVICLWFVPRSGSNYLADEMRKTGLLGYPLEYFSYANMMYYAKRFIKMDQKGDILPELLKVRTSPNGIFAYKWNAGFDERLRPSIPAKTYNLFIDRRDRKRQAESYFIARKYNDWLGSRSKYDEAVSADDLQETLYFLTDIRINTEKMLAGKLYYYIDYEGFVENTGKVIEDILDFVEVGT